MLTQTTNHSLDETTRKSHRTNKIATALSILVASFTVLVGVTPCLAQTLFGSIVGTVTDTSGAAVVGATVTVVSAQTNDTRSVQTNDRGQYTLSTLNPGTYKVTITKQGFDASNHEGVEITANNIARIDAQLQVGSITQSVDVSTSAVQLQTDTAEVHSEITQTALQDVPQPTRTYEGVLNLVPGIAPPSGAGFNQGTNNPAKSLSFEANGTGTQGPNVRIDGVNATNQWIQRFTTFVPSTEAIQSINVVTNSPDAEQGLSGGPAVTVTLKSGSNGFHGSAYEININTEGMTRDFFQPVGKKVPHFVDNDAGVTASGPILRDKLFYFGSYEGDFTRQAYSGLVSIPTPTELSGNFFAAGDNTNGVVTAANQLYDPYTGDANGSNKTAFPGNVIPQSRINPIIAQQVIPYILRDDQPNAGAPGALQNNLFVKQANMYNLHKIDSKFDYIATSKLRVSARYSKQPYNSLLNPIFGTPLGGTSNNWPAFAKAGNGNYYEHGAITAISGSATYVFTPSLVADFTFGYTNAHQYLIPQFADVKYGQTVLGIPGTNQGAQQFLDGGFPDLAIQGYGGSTGAGTFGYSYPPMEYLDPVFEYVGNVTKTHGSHSIRAGFDLLNLHMNHDEIRQTIFYFSGAGTTQNTTGSTPGQTANLYNPVADFLLGAVNYRSTWVMFDDTLRMYEKDFAVYLRDQWQVNPKLTLNYGIRWEYYPVPNREKRGIEYVNAFTDPSNNTMRLCGVGTQPSDCGIHVSKKLFAPSVGIAYRPFQNVVVRTGFSLSYQQDEMGQALTQNFPAEQQFSSQGSNSYTITSNLSDGLPILTAPTYTPAGTVVIPPGTSNAVTTPLDFKRGYVESWNLTLEKQFGGNLVANLGYVGTHVVDQLGSYNYNFGTLGGGAASQPLNTPALKITGSTRVYEPIGGGRYNGLQASLNKRLSNGVSARVAYTWSRNISTGFGNGILIPAYENLDKAVASSDRTHNISVTATLESPFGPNRTWLTHGFGGQVLAGWAVSPTFTHLSGLPFSIAGAAASCNCPGNTQRADQVGPIKKVGRGVFGQAYFNPNAFRNVTAASPNLLGRGPGVYFGNAAANDVRGPGYTNIDASLSRNFHVWERINLVIRADVFNVMNHAHFANPGASLSNCTSCSAGTASVGPGGVVTGLNGYDTISSTAPLGRTLDQRYFRLGGRITW